MRGRKLDNVRFKIRINRVGIVRINSIVNPSPSPSSVTAGNLFFGNWTDFVLYQAFKSGR